MSLTTRESLVKSTLNKRSKIPKQFVELFDKGVIPFPACEFLVLEKQQLVHYSTHNWDKADFITPTVCIHGLNGSRLLFSDLLAIVDRHYPTLPFVALDLFGHGLSSCPSGKYNEKLFVDQIDRLLAHLGLGKARKVNIIGFSLGGAVAVAFARHFPDRIAKLVLISPAGFVPVASKSAKKAPPTVQTEDDDEETHVPGIPSNVKLVKWVPSFILSPIMRMMFKAAFAHPQHELPPDVPQHIRDEHKVQTDRLIWQSFVKKGTFDATISIVKHFPLFNMEKDYSAVQDSVVGAERPVLLVWGTQDRVNPVSLCGEKIKSFFKNSFLLKVEDAGHVVLNEQPTVVISSILSFLQSPDDFRFNRD